MKYKDLIQFEPIESVVQLKEADDFSEAQKLVKTFVISDRMAEKLLEIVFPHLQYEKPSDNKGLLIVGNYGTGKSHLMSVISAIAEHTETVDMLQNQQVKTGAKQITGKFKVLRTEIGGTTSPLREIICSNIESFLESLGIDYSFPPMNKVTNNKDCFIEMMAEFEAQYPEQGFLVVVDELLDYLRTRKEQELILDLNFLREVGEVCKITRFRFIAGVQESLFENPRFQFVADTVRRVKDRFEQVRIAREDVAYVVSNRLLRKNDKQKALIRDYLQKFSNLYENMAEKLEQFVTLFPVHPTYLDVFERVYIAEKREVLKTISNAIKDLIEKQVPEERPGLISFDSYWNVIKENSSFKSIPEIREVMDKSQRLEGILNTSFTTPVFKPTAIRIIHALSVHRLTVGDIYSPIGLSAEALRDGLCLYLPMPEEDPEFLKTTIESIIKQIIKTVSGQFISYNKDNEHYYLDLKKDIDYDSLIEQKADSLDEDKLDEYYFDVLTKVLETGDTWFTGYKIWEYEISWKEKNTTRLGWLFFGAPNERSTAQPPRDFYLYFLKPFGKHEFEDEKKQDEVFFRLVKKDDKLTGALKLYAGAMEMALISSADSKKVYLEKAENHRKQVFKWIGENITSAFEITYKGVNKIFVEWIKRTTAFKENIKELVNTAASNCLSPYFKEQTPDYPVFSVLVSSKNRGEYAKAAIDWIATNKKTDLGAKILDALELLDGNTLKPSKSKYARFITDKLAKKARGHVVNRGEIIQDIAGVEYSVKYRLEPEWVVAILASLVYSGDITLALPGIKIDASNLEELAKKPLKDLIDFKHIQQPKDLPLNVLQELFDFFGIPRGLIVNPVTRNEAVDRLQKKVHEEVVKAVELQPKISDGIQSFGTNFLNESTKGDYRKKLDEYKSFLESLQVYNTPGKLKNFRYTAADIKNFEGIIDIIKNIQELLALKQEMDPLAGYINTAEMAIPADNPWMQEVKKCRGWLSAHIAQTQIDSNFKKQILTELRTLKQKYIEEYISEHKKLRLDVKDDEKKKKLLQSGKLKTLNKLKDIDLMPKGQLEDFWNKLGELKPCYSLTKEDMENTPVCPHCGLKPSEAKVKSVYGKVEHLEELLEKMYDEWTNTLLENLEDPMVKGNISLLKKGVKKRIEDFLDKKQLPEDIDTDFINAIKQVLEGLVKLGITLDEIESALISGGSPCTVEELKTRFNKFIDSKVKDKEVSKVRIILE